MEIFWYVIVFVFGAIIGSFLNVVIYRLHTGKSLNGRSHCMSCGALLTWSQLFPVLSYLFLKGKCRACRSYIPSRYFFVEVCTGIVFVTLYVLFHTVPIQFILNIVLFSILIVILAYDMRHMIIPDELVLMVGGVALCILGFNISQIYGWSMHLGMYDILAGLGASAFFAGLWFVSKGRWIGLGDAKLALPLGIIVGSTSVFSMVVLSFWIGAGISLMLLALERILKRGKTNLHFLTTPLTIKSEVPFAPFLIAGFALVHLFHANIFDITYTLFFAW